MDNNYFVIGKIVNTQGIKGEMRVMPSTDDITRFEELKTVYVQRKKELLEFEVQSVRYHKQFVLLKLKGIDDMTTAEGYKNCDVKITEDMAIPCEEDEYYIKDLYDMNVVTEDGEELGKIVDIIFTGANDVYVVKGENNQDDENSKNRKNEILIPAIKQCIINVDVPNNKMTVKLLEGLR